MSLYNMIHGMNPLSEALLSLLGKTKDSFGRFRDVYLDKVGDEVLIAVYTRCGGGNRESYQGVFDEMSEHPLYVRDADDDFDSTYATIYFRTPESARELVERFYELGTKSTKSPQEKQREFLETLRSPGALEDERVKKLAEAMKPLFDKISRM